MMLWVSSGLLTHIQIHVFALFVPCGTVVSVWCNERT